MKKRELEQGIYTDLKDELTYGGYLALDEILNAQHPLSEPVHHDEILFIIQHQVSELWFKLILHELEAAMAFIRNDELRPCFKILARVKQVQHQLFNQWAVLETLTPSDYLQFRSFMGHASGFQSFQFRKLEFLLGNKNRDYVKLFEHDPAAQEALLHALENPSFYDEFLLFLHRKGHNMPAQVVDRDWSQPYEESDAVVSVFKNIYENTRENWDAYDMAEKLVDLEENFLLWRFRHMKTVERIIGFKRGTGGSSGVEFLKKAVDIRLFPELIDVRTVIGE